MDQQTRNLANTVDDYLGSHNVLSLATSDGQYPWVAPVFYAHAGADLYFLSAAHTRHCRNLAANPQVAASIQEDYREWGEIRGVQLSGQVYEVDLQQRAAVIECYQSKFAITGPTAPEPIKRALDKISWYRLSIDELLFVDNTVAFGHRAELDPALLAKL